MDPDTPDSNPPPELPGPASTGVAGLDEILNGGLPRDDFNLVQGVSGTGKTTLALQFLLAGAEAGEVGLYVTLSQTKRGLEAIAARGFTLVRGETRSEQATFEAALEKLSGEHIARFAGQSWDTADRKGMDALKTSGVKIVSADAALQAEVKKRSAPIIEDWIGKASAKGVNARAILAEFHRELKQVASGK